MLEQVPPLESGTGSLNNPLMTLKNMMNASPSALDHSNEGDEPGSAFVKSNEQKFLSGLSPLHANIVKRNKNIENYKHEVECRAYLGFFNCVA